MNLKLHIILLLTLSIAPQLLISQNIPYQGTPYIENFNPNSQNTRGQILTIAQDQRGIMYFGGKNGLYEFDGASWRNYPISNKTSIKSLAIDSLGIIYAGGNNDFGVFMPNATGSLEYHSLYLPAPKGAPFFQSIMKTFITDQGVYFISKKRIFRYKNNSIEVIHVNLQAPCAFFVNGTIYVKDLAKGLCKIDETQIIPLEGCEEFNALTKSYFFINSYSDNELLFSLIKENLFFTYNTVSHVLKPFTISDDTKRYLEENFQFTSTQTARGDFAIGTAKGGILLMNKKGETIRIINTNRGLSTNLIYSVFSDAEDNLWASSFKGVSRIDISHPAIFYNKNQGLETNVVCSKYHNNTQYIGTNTNFYYLPEHNFSVSNDNHVIKRIKPTHEPNQIFDVNGHLLVANWYGVDEVIKDKVNHFYRGLRVFCAAYDKQYPNKIALGQKLAVVICSFKETDSGRYLQLTDTLNIQNNNISQIVSMAFDKDGNLWLASYNEGIFLIRFKDKDLKEYQITRFTEKNGLPKEIQEPFITNFNQKINIGTQKGIYKVVLPPMGGSDSLIHFTHDSFWGDTFTKDSSAVSMIKQIDSTSYFITGNKTGVLSVDNNKAYFDWKPFLKLGAISSISVENKRYLNIGQFESFCIFDRQIEKDYNRPFNVLIRKVVISSNDSLLFDGTFFEKEEHKIFNSQPQTLVPTLDNKYNSLKINFSACYFESSSQNQYSYMMEGFDKDWSPWSSEPSAVYTNIPHGKLKFKVKAKNVFGTISNIETYSFIVKPAWYQTKWAYISYCLLSILIIALITKLYSHHLMIKNMRLETVVKKRTHELEETIEKLKETQSTLIQQEKMASLGILTAGVAHEINNPLNYILGGYTGLDFYFQENKIEDEDVQLLMDSIKTGVDRAADIVSGLNQFSRTQNTFDEKCDLHSILDNSILMIKHLLKNRIEMVKNYTAESSIVSGNVGKLHQVFINILTNACQAIKKDGIITVTTTTLDQSLIIEIKDNGEGIQSDILDKITDPFFTTKEPGQGSGLGLSITYRIIEEHKGKLQFKSEFKKGTIAIITLPLIPTKNAKN